MFDNIFAKILLLDFPGKRQASPLSPPTPQETIPADRKSGTFSRTYIKFTEHVDSILRKFTNFAIRIIVFR